MGRTARLFAAEALFAKATATTEAIGQRAAASSQEVLQALGNACTPDDVADDVADTLAGVSLLPYRLLRMRVS